MRRISMISAGFEPAIPAIKWLQTYTLDHTAPGVGLLILTAVWVRTVMALSVVLIGRKYK
jgi:hypothetical protein